MIDQQLERISKAMRELGFRSQELIEYYRAKSPDNASDKLIKSIENVYFGACVLRNTAAAAIDTLHLQLQLKDKEFPEAWADDIVYSSTGTLNESGIIIIHIPEALPRYSREIGLPFKKLWQGYVYSALKKIKTVHGSLPFYSNAIVYIEVHSSSGPRDSFSWDTSNRFYNLIINALNGILFPEDNAKCMSFLVTGVFDEAMETIVHIGDFERHLPQLLQNFREAVK